jgi:hypothetical protein
MAYITLHQETPTKSHPVYMTFDEEDINNINRESYKWNNQKSCT